MIEVTARTVALAEAAGTFAKMLVQCLSTLASVVGLAAAVPQLVQMMTVRSAAGQSEQGWTLGAVTNTVLLYLNVTAYHAPVLAAGNAVSLVLCLIAISLIRRYGDAGEEAPVACPDALLSMPCHEFQALKHTVDHVHRIRSSS